MADRNLVIKYLKVKALAEKGVRGERTNAQALLVRLEADNPGLKEAALEFIKAEALRANSNNGSSTPPGVWPKEQVGNWENIFRYASAAFSGAYHFAEVMQQVQIGYQLGSHVKTGIKLTKAKSILITLEINSRTYGKIAALNPSQQRAFRQKVHELVEEQLDKLFTR
jgi:hypothetical protein